MGGEADFKVLFKDRREASILDPTLSPVRGTCIVDYFLVLCPSTCLEKDKKKPQALFVKLKIFSQSCGCTFHALSRNLLCPYCVLG